MSGHFDPYHQWLGIPAREQPPHHYRLLGITEFEDDPRVIDAAADRQLTYLRKFRASEHSSAAATLQNEIARARLCLLKSETKAEYDRKLSARNRTQHKLPPEPTTDTSVHKQRENRFRSPTTLAIGLTTVLSVVIVGIVWKLVSAPSRMAVAASESRANLDATSSDDAEFGSIDDADVVALADAEDGDSDAGQRPELIKELTKKKSALIAAMPNPATPEQADSLLATCQQLASEADTAGQFRMALEVFEAAADHLKKPPVKLFKDRALWLARQKKTKADAFDASLPARQKLKSDPQHPKSNLTWGLFVCFHQGDWQAGLPMLVKSKDRFWKPLAESELSSPQDVAGLLKLGDEWLDASKKGPEPIFSVARGKADALFQSAWNAVPDNQREKAGVAVDQRFLKLFDKSLIVSTGNPTGVALPGTDRFNPTNDLTVEFWVSTLTMKGALLSKIVSEQDASFVVHLDQGRPQLGVRRGAGEGGSGTEQPINDGGWHHFALVKQGDSVHVFVDGKDAMSTKIESPVVSGAPWRLGACRDKESTLGRFARVRISGVARYTEPFSPQKTYIKDPDTLFAN